MFITWALPLQVPLVTRREQLGTDDKSLEEKAKQEQREQEEAKQQAQLEQEKAKKRKGKGKGKEKGKGMKKPASAKGRASKKVPPKTDKETKEKEIETDKETKTKEIETDKETKTKEIASSKAPKRTSKPEQKTNTAEKPAKTTKKMKDGEDEAKDDGVAPKRGTATWAGRWVPSDPVAKMKFDAIRKVYEECCAGKLKSQSMLATHFYTACNKAFVLQEVGDDAPMEKFIEIAELEVDGFMSSDRVRNLAFARVSLIMRVCPSPFIPRREAPHHKLKGTIGEELTLAFCWIGFSRSLTFLTRIDNRIIEVYNGNCLVLGTPSNTSWVFNPPLEPIAIQFLRNSHQNSSKFWACLHLLTQVKSWRTRNFQSCDSEQQWPGWWWIEGWQCTQVVKSSCAGAPLSPQPPLMVFHCILWQHDFNKSLSQGLDLWTFGD